MNALDEAVDLIATPIHLDRLPIEHEPQLFFDGGRFLDYLQGAYKAFDVLTYSLSRSDTAPLRRINRLMTNLPLSRTNAIRPKEVRIVVNNHAKLFLCYDGVLQAAYVGSQNLSHGTQINIMYRVDYNYNQVLLDFFNQMWRKASCRTKSIG